MAFSVKVFEKYGTIEQGNNEIRVQKVSFNGKPAVYDIRVWSGDFAVKGASFGPDALKRLRDIIGDHLGITSELEVVSEKEVASKSEVTSKPETKTVSDKVIHALTSIPVNDCNYPINTATVKQLTEAIQIMEADTKGSHKTRIARCKAKLKSLQRSNAPAEPPKLAEPQKIVKITTTADTETAEPEKVDIFKTESSTETEATESKSVSKKADIIQFPKKDTTEIKRLAPSGEQYSYEEAEAKMNKELKMFKGDCDSEYVINGILELAKVDQEFCNNVMRPEKSYVGAFQYFANKARQGYCMMVGNIGVMDANTALKYAIDYFNADLTEPEPPKTKASNVTDKTKAKNATRKAGGKK